MSYYAYGAVRSGTSANLQTDRTYTGQKSDNTGLMYYQARFYDPALGVFLSPDTLVPDPNAVIDYNRFLYVRGNPLKYVDPSGHFTQSEIEQYLQSQYGDLWQQYLAAWASDSTFWSMLLLAQIGDELWAPTSPSLGHGTFINSGNAPFDFYSHQGNSLYEFQEYGPYRLTSVGGDDKLHVEKSFSKNLLDSLLTSSPVWEQPLYRYSKGSGPVYSGYNRRVTYQYDWGANWAAGDSMPIGPELFAAAFGGTLVVILCPACDVAAIGAAAATGWGAVELGTAANNFISTHHVLTVDLVDKRTWLIQGRLPCAASACFQPGRFTPPDESQGILK